MASTFDKIQQSLKSYSDVCGPRVYRTALDILEMGSRTGEEKTRLKNYLQKETDKA